MGTCVKFWIHHSICVYLSISQVLNSNQTGLQLGTRDWKSYQQLCHLIVPKQIYKQYHFSWPCIFGSVLSRKLLTDFSIFMEEVILHHFHKDWTVSNTTWIQNHLNLKHHRKDEMLWIKMFILCNVLLPFETHNE